jgi:hypothetical protein
MANLTAHNAADVYVENTDECQFDVNVRFRRGEPMH